MIDPDGFRSAAVGAPPDAEWIEITSDGPIDQNTTKTKFYAQVDPQTRVAFERNTPGWAVFHGFQVSIFGHLERDPDSDTGKPMAFLGDDGAPWFTLRARRMTATWPGAPLQAEFYWHPGFNVSEDIKRIRGGATAADRERAAAALRALQLFSENRQAEGRPSLARGLSEYQREKADRAIELRSKGYKWDDVAANTETKRSAIQAWVKQRRIELGQEKS